MGNFPLVVLFAVLHLFTLNKAAPSTSLDSSQLPTNLTELYEPEVPVRYDGAQLWAVDFSDDRTKRIVVGLKKDFDVSLWSTNGSTVDLFLRKSAIDGGVSRILSDANVRYSVIIDDMQRQIDDANPTLAPEDAQYLQNRNARFTGIWRNYKMPETISKSSYLRLKGAYMGYNSFEGGMENWPHASWGHRMTWRAYHRMDDIYSYLDFLVKNYPDLCSVQTIGYSIEKRALKVLKISNGNEDNKAVWIDGGIHAREWISPASVTYFINELLENWEDQPKYMQNIDWYILPVMNPDGYEYTHTNDRLWRKNRNLANGRRCAGIDLNRNFGHRWGGKGTSQNPCLEIYAGRHAFSEPESLSTKRFLERKADEFCAYLTFHSYGQYILHPWGYDEVVPPDYKDLDYVGREGAKAIQSVGGSAYSVGPSAKLLYPAAGGSDDWAKSIGIKYSYTVELRDKGRYGFVLPAQYIEPTAKEAIAFIRAVSRACHSKRKQ